MIDNIRIGHIDFTIVWEDPTHSSHGLCDYNKSRITINPLLTDKEQVATLLHEIYHALAWFFSASGDQPEERWADVAANGMLMVLRDNPELYKMLGAVLYPVEPIHIHPRWETKDDNT